MATHRFQVDPIASNLKDGDRPDCAGLVLVVGWGWGIDPKTRYEEMASEMASLDPDALLVYHPQHIHCTVATLSSFKNPKSIFFKASTPDRARIVRVWHQSLSAAFRRNDSVRPFEITFRSLEVYPEATFLQADDPSNTMAVLRSIVKDASEDPRVQQLSVELEAKYGALDPDVCSLKDALHIPDIIHSTVMRTAAEPSDPQRLGEGLAELNARWTPTPVRITEISLVFEKHPYMHLNHEDGLPNFLFLPFC